MADNNDVWIRNKSTGFKIKATEEKWMVTSRGYSRGGEVDHTKSLTAYLKQQCGIQSTDIKPDG